MASIETPKTKKKSKSSKTSEAAAGSRTVKSASVKKGSSGSQAAPIPTQANEKASSQSQQNESSDYSLSTESRKGSAETHFSRKTSGSVKSGFSMAASILSVKSALSAFLNPKGVSADAESEDVCVASLSLKCFSKNLRSYVSHSLLISPEVSSVEK